MKCGICGKEMIKLADGVNYGCDYCNIQTLLYRPNTGIPIDSSQQYIDMLNKESSELLVNSLTEKDQKIAELQKQLEEKEKIIQMQQNIKRFDIGDMLQENIKLRQQLHSQPAEIVEKIKQELGFIINNKERVVCDGSMTGDKYILSVLDNLLKEYQK